MWFYSGISMTLSSRDSFSESNTLFTCFQIFRSSPPPIDLFFRSFLGGIPVLNYVFPVVPLWQHFTLRGHLIATSICIAHSHVSLFILHYWHQKAYLWICLTTSHPKQNMASLNFINVSQHTQTHPQNPSSFSNKSSFLHKVYISTRIQQQLHRLHVAWSIRSSGEKWDSTAGSPE